MKHWTEPKGILLIQIPTEWQYRNSAVEGVEESSPFSFEPYENAVGCFQISCYPLEELAPKIAEDHPNGVSRLEWKHSRIYDSEFCVHMFFGALADQALIGKYIHDAELDNDKRIERELRVVKDILKSVVVVPPSDRKLASDMNKFDRFEGALAASYDLLNNAIESESFIEAIAVVTNQIDAFLRLSIVIAIQLENETDEIQIEYLYQSDNERGIMERKIFEDAFKYNIITEEIYEELASLYKLRNRVIHRYIISNIKTRDLPNIAVKYLEAAEKVRLALRDLENRQVKCHFGVYGKKFGKVSAPDEKTIKRLYANVNDKHIVGKFIRKVADN
jgi:ribosomal protein L20A (L18A)